MTLNEHPATTRQRVMKQRGYRPASGHACPMWASEINAGPNELVWHDAEDDTFNLVGGHYSEHDPYWFDADRADTPEKLLKWIRHLSTKNWFTGLHAIQLIDRVTKRHGIEVDWHA